MTQSQLMLRRSHADARIDRREAKAHQILEILEHEYGSLLHKDVLDVGTGSGVVPSLLRRHCHTLVSVDVTDERLVHDFDFELVASEDLPFAGGSFDVVVSNHVIEHVLQAPAHLREIRRVLREDGVAYLATPNKWTIMEPHFKLPGLSWLPKHLADRYVRMMGRGEHYDVDLLTYRQLAALATDAGLRVIDQSNALVTRRIQRLTGVRQRLTDHLRPLFPSFVVLLRPETGDRPSTRLS